MATTTLNRKPSPPRPSTATSAAVGIDLGAATVRVVETELTGEGGGRLLRRGKADFSPQLWNNLHENGANLTLALREALASAGIAEKTVSVGLPRRLVTLRQVRLPHAPPDQLRNMVAFEAQQYLLFSLDEVILDYFVVPDPPGYGDDMMTVMLAAAQRSLVGEVINSCEKAGLTVARLTVSALALAENVALERETTAIIDIEPGEMDVAMIAGKRLLFTRASAVETSALPPDAANQRLADEIGRSLTAYANEFRQSPLQQIYLSGSSESELRMLESSLPELLEMPVRRLRTRLVDSDETGTYATALGVALQSRNDGIGQINLAPRDREERRIANAKKRGQLIAAVAGIAVVGTGLLWLQSSSVKAQKRDAETRQANLDLKSVTDKLDAKKKTVKRLQDFKTELSGGIARKQPLVDVLFALNDCVPRTPDIWLTQTNFERGGTITLRGETKNEMAATDFVLALQRSGAFSEVRLGYLGEAQTQEPGGNTATPTPTPKSTPTGSTNPTTPPSVTPLPGLPGQNSAGGNRPGNPPTSGNSGANPTATPTPNPANTPKPAQPGTPAVVQPNGNTNSATVPKPITKSTNSTVAPKRTPRTSFIITCRLNANAKTLLPENRERKTPVMTTQNTANKLGRSSKKPLLESDTNADETDTQETPDNATP